ncbi:putative transposon Ty3-I Gag-Pol polyprotein [Apostichopus japonicus]|uniref:Putative transposon Ty3-I Gag-Pol polyprotein n=1 Tax=Stichopus japonicus TaxID=307972 RepID=A0A2G8L762_STIJA|nr:putative transposon Ty3-I Gag-Pol polyprotein [Apostichopus japonicus]
MAGEQNERIQETVKGQVTTGKVTTILPPRTAQKVACTVKSDSIRPEANMVYLVQGAQLEVHSQVEVMEGCISCSSSTILVLNHGDCEVFLHQTQYLHRIGLEGKEEVLIQHAEDGIQVNIQEVLISQVEDDIQKISDLQIHNTDEQCAPELKESTATERQRVTSSDGSGSLRLCIDYRQLNAITVKDSFPLPRIDETLEALGGAKYFSSLDLSHGYFQIAMHHESIHTLHSESLGDYMSSNRMPQGLCNSPSTFQRIMELIFGDLNLSEVILYLGDILVFSSTFGEHLERLEKVFERLQKYGLKLKGEKCDLFQREVKHLGHVVNADGVSVDPDKVDRIVNWPVPTNISELSSFLGLASYYRRFVPDFAKLASPLMQ